MTGPPPGNGGKSHSAHGSGHMMTPNTKKEREDKKCIAVYRSDKGNCIDSDSRWVDVQRVEFPIGLSSPPTVADHKALMATRGGHMVCCSSQGCNTHD